MNKIAVCIVEDVTDIRQALEQIIELSDNCVLAASFSSGEEALIKIPIIQPDVVLMDIGLGSTNGIDLVKELKPQHPEILYMMCTVYEEDEKIFDALRAGASGYILKKSSPSKLLDAIGELVDGGAPMSSQIALKVVNAFKDMPVVEAVVPGGDNEETSVLTKKEKAVLEKLAQGLIYKEIGNELDISPETVRKHVYHIYEKLHVNNRVEAVNKFYGR
ncbi:LuxR family two component transcriptional regulator [Lacibacter cauensis]|uniref:LuxR family two component transcriptional regulator n=1 Tax=Lacibacter cauensis TaxID=510947 RepID=A0A562SSY2_9BACT|nr:response regulator transcription factor [Lacibacter cauensis]TWI83890.1 LuxR family two component transcriptional regulator [Lacibacter cauensis]